MSNFYISPAYSKYEINTYNLTHHIMLLLKVTIVILTKKIILLTFLKE